MNKEQEQQLVDYYSTTDTYIRSQLHSNAHQSVFTKENDKFQWLVLEQKSKSEVEVRQTDSHGTITARDSYELTRNIPKCVGVERLHKDVNMQIPFNADEINLDTLVANFPDTYTLIGQDEVSKTYSFPKSYVSYRKPRTVSTEQRERARQMMIERNKTEERLRNLVDS